jgi:hypothetical protein
VAQAAAVGAAGQARQERPTKDLREVTAAPKKTLAVAVAQVQQAKTLQAILVATAATAFRLQSADLVSRERAAAAAVFTA